MKCSVFIAKLLNWPRITVSWNRPLAYLNLILYKCSDLLYMILYVLVWKSITGVFLSDFWFFLLLHRLLSHGEKRYFCTNYLKKVNQYTFTCVCVFIDNPYTCCFCSFLSILYENLWFCDYCKSKNGNEITSQLKQQEIMILEQLWGVNGCFHS